MNKEKTIPSVLFLVRQGSYSSRTNISKVSRERCVNVQTNGSMRKKSDTLCEYRTQGFFWYTVGKIFGNPKRHDGGR